MGDAGKRGLFVSGLSLVVQQGSPLLRIGAVHEHTEGDHAMQRSANGGGEGGGKPVGIQIGAPASIIINHRVLLLKHMLSKI